MKIFYAVQATGNGHISRAMEILPYLSQYGRVDLFLSGANSTLPFDAPVKFRSKGVCFFYNSTGSLHYGRTVTSFAPWRVLREARDLPVEKYDLVINDFECITSIACAMKKVPSVNFGHQASFMSAKIPRPRHRSLMGEFILHHYARASQYVGLHFKCYDDFILTPIIKKTILCADRSDKGHVAVYLPSYSDRVVSQYLLQLKDFQFEVFSKEIKQPVRLGNIRFMPVDKELFNNSLIDCHGIITNAGFETPAEALSLGKKLLVIPIKGQYEQLCNATALEQMGVPRISSLDKHFPSIFSAWICNPPAVDFSVAYSTQAIIGFLMQRCKQMPRISQDLEIPYPDLAF